MYTGRYVLILLTGVFLSSISQVMLKKASLRRYPSRIQEYCNPLVITAYLIFFGTTFLSVYAYKGIPLSMGPVLEATGYFYVTIFGAVFFQEKFSRKKFCALALIVLGIVVYAI